MVRVILCKDDKVLGDKGQVINVSEGYARNYLIPRKLAIRANEGNVKHYETIMKAQAKKIAKYRTDEEVIRKKAEDNGIHIMSKAGENKKLFGSITADMLAKALNEQLAIDIDRRRIVIPAPIKMVGKHNIKVRLKYNVVATIPVEVKAEIVKDDHQEEGKEEVVSLKKARKKAEALVTEIEQKEAAAAPKEEVAVEK